MNDQVGALIFEFDKLHAVPFSGFFECLGAAQSGHSYALVYLRNISNKLPLS